MKDMTFKINRYRCRSFDEDNVSLNLPSFIWSASKLPTLIIIPKIVGCYSYNRRDVHIFKTNKPSYGLHLLQTVTFFRPSPSQKFLALWCCHFICRWYFLFFVIFPKRRYRTPIQIMKSGALSYKITQV